MAAILALPRLGETMEEGRVAGWLKKPGDAFKRGETIVEIDDEAELLLIGLWRGKRRHARLLLPAIPAKPLSTGNCGALTCSSSDAFSILTLRSYQAAWPVTGSELE